MIALVESVGEWAPRCFADPVCDGVTPPPNAPPGIQKVEVKVNRVETKLSTHAGYLEACGEKRIRTSKSKGMLEGRDFACESDSSR